MVSKRNRASLSCTFCKKRKIKCDRQQPCSTCVKRGRDDCVYAKEEHIDGESADMVVNEINILRQKIRRLEQGLKQTSGSEGSDRAGTRESESPGLLLNGEFSHSGPNLVPVAASLSTQLMNPVQLPPITQIPAETAVQTANIPTTVSSVSSHVPSVQEFPSMAIKPGFVDPVSALCDKYMGQNPFLSPDDEYECLKHRVAYQGKDQRCRAFGGYSDLASVWYDPILVKVLEYQLSRSKKNNFQPEHILPESMKDLENQYDEVVKTVFGRNDNTPFKEKLAEKMKSKEAEDATMASATKSGFSIGLLPKHESVADFTKTLHDSLPPQKIVWRLVDIYFTKFNWLYPIFEKSGFKHKLSQLIGPEGTSDGPVPHIEVVKRVDFAVLGQLFIMLRIASLTLISNSYKSSDSMVKDDLYGKYAIGVNFVNLSSRCLDNFDILKVSSIDVLLLVLLHRIYKLYAPEEGLRGIEQEHTSLGVLVVNMAKSMGANLPQWLDLSEYELSPFPNKLEHVWWTIYDIELYQSCYVGSFMIMDSDLPLTRQKSAQENPLLCSAEGPNFPRALTETMTEILLLTTNVKRSPKLTTLFKDLDTLEYKVLGSSSPYQLSYFFDTSISAIERCKNVKTFLTAAHVEVNILLTLYSYYSKKQAHRLTSFYIEKLLVVIIVKFFPLCHQLVETGAQAFPDIGDFTFIQDYILMLQKGSLALEGFIARFEVLKRRPPWPIDTDIIDDMLKMLHHVTRHFNRILVNFATKYITAWLVATDSIDIIKVVESDELYESREFEYYELENEDLKSIHKVLQTCYNEAQRCTNGIIGSTSDTQNVSQKQTHHTMPAVDHIGTDLASFDNFSTWLEGGDFHIDEFYADGFLRTFMDS